jgi:hypothetical protein
VGEAGNIITDSTDNSQITKEEQKRLYDAREKEVELTLKEGKELQDAANAAMLEAVKNSNIDQENETKNRTQDTNYQNLLKANKESSKINSWDGLKNQENTFDVFNYVGNFLNVDPRAKEPHKEDLEGLAHESFKDKIDSTKTNYIFFSDKDQSEGFNYGQKYVEESAKQAEEALKQAANQTSNAFCYAFDNAGKCISDGANAFGRRLGFGGRTKRKMRPKRNSTKGSKRRGTKKLSKYKA